ncbi:MAG: recombinase family protein [Desulfomonilaceae bacterium]
MQKAAIYARVSTEDQAQHGVSLDAQVNRCMEYVTTLNYELVDTAIDAGLSAKSTDRAGLQRILSLVHKKKIQHVVTLKLDRLSRRTVDALNLVETFTKKKVKLHLVTENGTVNSDNSDEEFMLTLKAGVAQLERKKIAERTRFALDRKRQLGQRISLYAPYGYAFTAGKLIPNPEEQAVITKIYNLHARGFTIRGIIEQLTGEGIFNRKNRPFAIPSIHRILKIKERHLQNYIDDGFVASIQPS